MGVKRQVVGLGTTIQVFPLTGSKQHQGKNPGRPLPMGILAKGRVQEAEVALGQWCRWPYSYLPSLFHSVKTWDQAA